MIVIASLIFVLAFYASVTAIATTIRKAMPRIREVVDMAFAPAIPTERRIILGEMRRPAPVSSFKFPMSYEQANRSPVGRQTSRYLAPKQAAKIGRYAKQKTRPRATFQKRSAAANRYLNALFPMRSSPRRALFSFAALD